MKTIPISEATLNAVIQYLASCPFAHVENLIVAIRVDVEKARQADKPAEPAKPDAAIGEVK